MEKQASVYHCVETMMEVIPLLRGSINAYIHSEVDRSQWITPGQTRLLYLISQGAVSISNLSARQKTSPPTISRQVECLVEKGLVLRNRNLQDRRVVALKLTPKGEEILNGIMQSTRQWIAGHLEHLDPAQVDGIIRSFETLREIFRPEES